MLEIDWTTEEPSASTARILVIPLRPGFAAAEIEARFGRGTRLSLEAAPFSGKPGEQFSVTRELDGALQRVLFLGTGDKLGQPADLLRFAHDLVRQVEAFGLDQAVVDLRWTQAGGTPWVGPQAARAGALVAQGLELGTYAYTRFQSEPKPQALRRVVLWAESKAAAEGTATGRVVAAAVKLARDLSNGPGELVTPTFLANTAREIAERLRDHDVTLKVLERAECQALGMGCFLGVAKGSDEPPKFIHLHAKPKATRKGSVALIGKGVTFDSGGYSLKPSDGMMDMKMDMSGAAAVLAAFEALVRLGAPWEVHAIVAATENMIGAHAYRLGDVLTASNGKTVEINNTDAEGRLTLADALVYASRQQPDVMLDFATLTGACMVALGPRIAGVMSRDEALVEDWLKAAERSGETMWRLPLPDDLKEQLKSKIADLRNTGERFGGALTAGLFLSEFAEGKRWLHVDLAGPAMAAKPYGVTTAGGTGFAVSTILELLQGDVLRVSA